MQKGFRYFFLFVGLSLGLSGFAQVKKESRYDYTNQRRTRSKSPSVVLKQDLEKSVEFVYNRGKGSEAILDSFLQLIDPAQIKKMKGYKNPQSTRIELMTYEVRSMEAVQRIEQLLDEGFQVRLVADSGPPTLLEAPSAKVQKQWSNNQKRYYLGAYDLDFDGEVSEKDIAQYNKERSRGVTNAIWEQLEALKKSHPKKFEFVATPYEMVPADDASLYVRLTHFKSYGVAFQQTDDSWKTVKEMVVSANMTDSCMSCRIATSKENQQKYLSGEAFKIAKGSEGNIQFGAVLNDAKMIEALKGPREKWIEAYKKGEHFDSVRSSEVVSPRVVIEDPKTKSRTMIEALYSEGTKFDDQKTIDPVYIALTEIISNPENELKVYYDADFVFTHKGVARHLRHHLASGHMEDWGVWIDGNFANEAYSALPDLLYAPHKNNSKGVLSGKSIQELQSPKMEEEWQKKVFVFEGERGVYGAEGDKLHAKTRYFEYVDGAKQRHYVVIWGSGNNSTNAGKLNADGVYIMDSTDERVRQAVLPFFDGLKKEKRMRFYTNSFLERRLIEMFKPVKPIISGKSIEELQAPESFLVKFENVLNQQEAGTRSKKQLQKIVETLESTGTLNEAGENFLKIMNWYLKNSSASHAFGWADLDLVLFVSNPVNIPQTGFLQDLLHRWTGDSSVASETAIADFSKPLARFEKAKDFANAQTENISRIVAQCSVAWSRLGLPTQKPRSKAGVGP